MYRLGNWEYSYKYRDAPNSAQFSTLTYGAWVLELKAHLQAQVDGTSKIKYFHNVCTIITLVWDTSGDTCPSRSLTTDLFLLSLGSCKLRRWFGLECESQNLDMYSILKKEQFCRGSEVIKLFTSSPFLTHRLYRLHSSFIVLKLQNTSSVSSGVVNQWKPRLLWASLT